LRQLTAFQQAPELEDHRFVRQGLYTGVESRKRAHQRHVVPRLFRSISKRLDIAIAAALRDLPVFKLLHRKTRVAFLSRRDSDSYVANRTDRKSSNR
jgi:hypothetical protein